MEASVKERLTGALIFVAAVIVIVPEMFSGPGQQSTAGSQQRPEPGPPLRTFSMTLNDSGEAQVNEATPAPVQSVKTVDPLPPSPAVAEEPQPLAAEPAPAAQPKVVAAPPAVAAMVPSQAPAADGGWWVRLGLFGVRANAERLAARLRAAGFSIDMDTEVVNGKDMYRVRSGPVRSREEALALQARLKASGESSMLLPP